MADVLRLISIHIEEPEAGSFQWVTMERVGKQWTEVARASEAQHTYKQAMATGLIALEGMISDLDVGPRKALDESNEERTDLRTEAETVRSTAAKATHSTDAKPKSAAYFGFGPIR